MHRRRKVGKTESFDSEVRIQLEVSDENPVFYLQYAYARISNIISRSIELDYQESRNPDLSLLSSDIETELISLLISFPDYVNRVTKNLEPQIIINYLQGLAMLFHRFYSKNKVLTEDKKLSEARLLLIKSIQIILRNGLNILGISHPEKM